MRLSDSRLATPCDLPQRPSETPTTGLGPEFAGVRWYTRSQQPGAVQRALSSTGREPQVRSTEPPRLDNA
jgi:hypothetical protein